MKKLVREKLNEAVVPADMELYDEFFRIVMQVHAEKPADPFFELNQRLNPLGIYFIDHEKYFAKVEEPERSTFMVFNMVPHLGIRIFVFEPLEAQLGIIVDKTFNSKFLRIPAWELDNTLRRLRNAFGHETVHRGQVSRMKTAQDPNFDSKEDYFKNPQEIMAMAWTFVEDLKPFHSKEDLIDFLRTGVMPMPTHMRNMPAPPKHHIYTRYKRIGGKPFKLFVKYAYQYLTEE